MGGSVRSGGFPLSPFLPPSHCLEAVTLVPGGQSWVDLGDPQSLLEIENPPTLIPGRVIRGGAVEAWEDSHSESRLASEMAFTPCSSTQENTGSGVRQLVHGDLLISQ